MTIDPDQNFYDPDYDIDNDIDFTGYTLGYNYYDPRFTQIFICKRYKLAYVNSPKNASTTCLHTLGMLQHPELDDNISTEAIKENGYVQKVTDRSNKLIKFNILKNKGYKIFTICRNPYSRVVSDYRFEYKTGVLVQRHITFEDYIGRIESRKFGYMTIRNCTQWDNFLMDKVDELIRYENFVEEFKEKILDPIGVDIELPVLQYGGKYNYRDYYNEDLKERVYNLYKIDIDNLGYKF